MGKKKIIIIASAIALVVIAVILCIVLRGKKSNEEELIANMKKMGGSFYEEFYYVRMTESSDDVKEAMSRFEKAGIKVDLKNIAKVSTTDKKLVESMVNSKTKEKCNEDGTNVIIYPKAPYGKTDYTIEVTLDCGFAKKEK